ncbi:MAG: hypothetical protein HN945_13635 [Deltaproteobacteria bacterium]|jgi:hypothetical protein|nr:hypothetical protein [Deltaproteobacteria bacterium]MBT7153474.1 hypothetical protein [Deltaproteobacteria bacterium]
MQQETFPVSLHSYAFQLRKKLLKRASLQDLLDCHARHQEFLGRVSQLIDFNRLSLADRFAWKLLREINILSLDFSNEGKFPNRNGEKPAKPAQGIYLNLEDVVMNVQKIWFSEMKKLPSIVWLKRFSTRKLAHYSFKADEIAFSLIFDSMDAPAEIVSYLAYHELLHRQMGAKRVNGRQYAHTSEFKAQEHLFPNWRSIDQQINQYILNID